MWAVIREVTARYGCDTEDLGDALWRSDADPDIVALRTALEALLRPQEGDRLTSPDAVKAWLAAHYAGRAQEELMVIGVTIRKTYVRHATVAVGTMSHIAAVMADIFRFAVQWGVPGIFVVHNHPSGVAEPSPDDHATTRRLIDAGNLLGIEVLDHLIVARDGVISIREQAPSHWT